MSVPDPNAFYISKSIEELKQIAEQETAHSQRLQPIVDTWNAITTQVLQPAIEGLDIGIPKVRATWQDNTYSTAFEAPAMEARKSLQNSKDIIESVNVPGEIAELQTGVANAKTAFDAAYEAYQRANQPVMVGTDGAFAAMPPDPQVLENIRLQAVAAIVRMDQAFAIAGAQIAMAAQGHVWNGPRAAGAPTPGTTSSPNSPAPQGQSTAQSPGAGPAGEQPGAQPPGGEQPAGQQPGGQQPGGQQAGGQQPGGEQPGGQAPGGGDTGLAGGTAPPPTLPTTPTPTPTPPTPTPPPGPVPTPGPVPRLPSPSSPGGATVPVGGVAGPLAAAGGGARGGGIRGVEQAARNLTASPTAANSASAPSLPAPTAGSSSTQAPVGAGGVPPMMPPMAPPGAGGNTNRPRPGTAPAVGPGRSRPAGPNAGVPASLRGRSGQGDGTKPAPTSRRARRDGPQTVEILDSELWQVDEQNPAPPADRRTTRQSGPSQASGSMSAS